VPSDLKRLGFELRLLTHSRRLDPWATTEIIWVGNSQQLRRHAGIVDICVYEIQLPGIAERKGYASEKCVPAKDPATFGVQVPDMPASSRYSFAVSMIDAPPPCLQKKANSTTGLRSQKRWNNFAERP
jgi:hypothetical protein